MGMSPVTYSHCEDALSWREVPSPTVNTLRSVSMIDSNDGWAVGDNGTIIRWNGLSWSIVNIPEIVSVDLASVFMVNTNDGWIVGESGTVLRWEGISWKMVSSSLGIRLQVGLSSVFMAHSNDGWAVGWEKARALEKGTNGVVLRWDGSSWSKIWLSATDNLERVKSISLVDSSNGWAIGYTNEPDRLGRSGSCAVHWDGKSWRKVGDPSTKSLNSIFMVNHNDGWVVGGEGTILRWDGRSWGEVGDPSTKSLNSIFMVNHNDGWVVGGEGTILRYSKDSVLAASSAPTATIVIPTSSPTVPSPTPIPSVRASFTMTLIPYALPLIIATLVGAFLLKFMVTSKNRGKRKVGAPPSEQEIRSSLVSEYNRLNSELKAARQKLSKLTEAYSEGIIPKDTYGTLKDEYESKISKLEKSIDDIWPLKHPIASEYEDLSAELGTVKQKITKLTDSYAGGAVTLEAYRTLLTNYEKRSSELKREIGEIEARMKNELSILQEEELKITKQIELLSAKQLVGEIFETEYIAEKSNLDSCLTGIRRKRLSLTYLKLAS